jgi:hypothetical protein
MKAKSSSSSLFSITEDFDSELSLSDDEEEDELDCEFSSWKEGHL